MRNNFARSAARVDRAHYALPCRREFPMTSATAAKLRAVLDVRAMEPFRVVFHHPEMTPLGECRWCGATTLSVLVVT